MWRLRHLTFSASIGVLVLVLGGCLSTAQWVTASGEAATAEDIRTCRSLSSGVAAADTRGRGGLSAFNPGASDDLMMRETRYGEEERQRMRLYGDCMRRLGYRVAR